MQRQPRDQTKTESPLSIRIASRGAEIRSAYGSPWRRRVVLAGRPQQPAERSSVAGGADDHLEVASCSQQKRALVGRSRIVEALVAERAARIVEAALEEAVHRPVIRGRHVVPAPAVKSAESGVAAELLVAAAGSQIDEAPDAEQAREHDPIRRPDLDPVGSD